MKKIKKRWVRSMAGLAIALVFVGTTALPAQADYVVPPRADSPGAGYKYGIPTADMGSIDPLGENAVVGGWSLRNFSSAGRPNAAGESFNGAGFRFSEPYRNGAFIAVTIYVAVPSNYRQPVPLGPFMQAEFESTTQPYGKLICASSEWSTTQFKVTPDTSTIFSGNITHFSSGDGYKDTYPVSLFQISRCPYLVGMENVSVTTYMGKTQRAYRGITWNGDDWYTKKIYSGKNGGSVLDAACNVPNAAQIAGCRGSVDGLDPARYCDNPPQPSWLDFAWLNRWFGFWNECLWNPVGGWDSDGSLDTAVRTSAPATLSTVLSSIGTAWKFNGSCGAVVPTVASGAMKGFTVNTCAWSAFAPPLKTFLGIAVSVLSLWWLIGFMVRTFAGFANKKTPSPIAGDDN